MGYSEAHSDELITKEEFDKHVNEEIEEIVSITHLFVLFN